jgi:hypothetical protein
VNSKQRSRSWAVIFVFILMVFAFQTPAQKPLGGDLLPPVFSPNEEPSAFPFDFNDAFYLSKGVNPDAIIARRTGYDGLSVIGKLAGGATYNDVRVIATVPAYNQIGEPMFWYPLGGLQYDGFTETRAGITARQTAHRFPVYIFPDTSVASFSSFGNTRQAPVIDNSALLFTKNPNPLGVREIYVVTYTEMALGKDGVEIMAYYGKLNGYSIDGTPILKTVADIMFMVEKGYVTFGSKASGDFAPLLNPPYAISPVITAKGAIAADAFLWMSIKDGNPSASEELFVWHFECMKKTGDWCR